MKKKSYLIPKILGILFAVSVITACLELPDFEIRTVDLKGLGPVEGKTPAELNKIKGGLQYDVKEIKWYKNGDYPDTELEGSFEEGEVYTAELSLTANEGFIFSESPRINNIGFGGRLVKEHTEFANKSAVIVVEKMKVAQIDQIGEGDGDSYILDLTYLIAFPVTDGSPVENINRNAFSGTIKWDLPDGQILFAGGIPYTATVTLTAKTGYTFSNKTSFKHDIANESSRKVSATVSGDGTTATGTILFPPTEKVNLPEGEDYIAWADNPKATSYRIYFYFGVPVELKRGQVSISAGSGSTTPSPDHLDYGPSSVENTTKESKAWYVPLTVNTAGTVIIKITKNSGVSSEEKVVLVHKTGEKPVTQDIAAGALGGITVPAPNNTPEGKVDNGTGYAGGFITWRRVNPDNTTPTHTGPFAENTTYRAVFTLYATGNHIFADSYIPGAWTCSGSAKVEPGTPDGTSLGIEVTFPSTGIGGTPITAGNLGITLPSTGGTPQSSLTVPAGANYTVPENISWYRGTAGTVAHSGSFEAATVYRAEVTLEAATGYTFTNFTGSWTNTGVANNEVTVSENTGKKITLKVVFPITAAAPVAVTSVSLSPTTLSLTAGGTGTLTASILPANAANKNVTWASSNTSVATVSQAGPVAAGAVTVTAVAAGSATITVTTVDGSKTAVCTVAVESAGPVIVPVTVDTVTQNVQVTAGADATVTGISNGYQVVTTKSYGPNASFKVDLGTGKTLTDYQQIKFTYNAVTGDVGYKDIWLLASDTAIPADVNMSTPNFEALAVSGLRWQKSGGSSENLTATLGTLVKESATEYVTVPAIGNEIYFSIYLHSNAATYSVANIEFVPATPAADTPIAAFNLGIALPATGGTPHPAVGNGTGYTGGNVSWFINSTNATHSGSFAAGTAYRAEVTLTAAANYTFTGFTGTWTNTGVANTQVAASDNTGGSIKISVVFPATIASGTPGTATITFTVTDLGSMNITNSGAEINKPNDSLTLSVTGLLPSYTLTWYVDGEDKGPTSSITINAADYRTGGHSVILVIKNGNVYYSSNPATFYVK
jgi:hypothetical protein